MRIAAPLALASLLALIAACSGEPTPTEPPPGSLPPEPSVVISPAVDTISPGESVQLTATFHDGQGRQAACTACTWSSSDTTVATVSSTGLLASLRPGTVTITAVFEAEATSASVTLVVHEPDGPGSGTVLYPGDDLQARINTAPPGTAFILRAGIHRLQSITPKDGMSFSGEPGAILSGARVLTEFSREGRYWVATGQTQQGERISDRRPNGERVCRHTHPRCNYPEDLFIDDVQLRHVARLSEVGPGTWYFDYAADKIYFIDDPTGRKVEATVTPRAFQGLANNISIRSLIIEKYATPASHGAIQDSAGTGWVVEDNELRWNHSSGIRTGPRMVARRNYTHHNGQYGINGSGADVLVEDNEIAYNHTNGFENAWGAGGSKWNNTQNLVLRRNFAHHNKGPGLWVDIFNRNTLIEENRVEDNDRNGIFFEISYGAVIRNNTCARNGFGNAVNMRGGGIAVTSSANVEIYGNTLVDNKHGFAFNQDDRGTGPHGPLELINLHVHDNTVTMSGGYTGLNVEGTDLSYYTSKSNRFENNTYNLGSNPRYFWWQKGARSEDEWKRYGQDVTGTFNRR